MDSPNCADTFCLRFILPSNTEYKKRRRIRTSIYVQEKQIFYCFGNFSTSQAQHLQTLHLSIGLLEPMNSEWLQSISKLFNS